MDGKTIVECKAAAADEATLFMQELLGSVETLSSIAEIHGARTLSDLMCLQSSIIGNAVFDYYPELSAVMDIASGLPSGEHWAKFINTKHLEHRETVGDV